MLPQLILEDRVVGRVNGLYGDDGVPLPSDDEGALLEIGTPEERRGIVGDAVVEVDTLSRRDEVLVGGCRLGQLGEKRGVAEGRRRWGR